MIEQKLKTYRLNQEEYQKIKSLLGREPQNVEWALFSALWSEHCSYKSSRVHLKNLYREAPQVLESMGENAGIVDLGQGERIAFKMESHNHPSYIEPYQGAATGVGGILRDIFTMGARPIALADYLCFGDLTAERMPELIDGVVRGIGGYGNCVGVPTISGQTEFHFSYNKNILVNAMAVGYFGPNDPICISKAKGVGNLVVYVGAKTGRDGVHGASMASESFGAESASKRPTVQIGDPFFEKLLIESCLQVMRDGLVVAIQDMGAAGLTSSSFEMASKGGVGMRLNLDQVPLRDFSVGPEEILLSESQERMLLVCEPKKLDMLKAVFDKWGLDATPIGEIISEKRMYLYWKGDLLTEIDPDLLVENAPSYQRAYHEWKPKNRTNKITSPKSNLAENNKKLLEVLESIQGCSRSWIYRQYDQRVGTRTQRDSHNSVAVQKLDHSGRALGIALGCRPYVMRFDAQVGGLDAVAYPSLELAAKGFRPYAVTDCLNFGNPEKPEIMSEFVATLIGMNAICKALQAPIISGNVSFYNETQGQNITSTPSTGVVGLREKFADIPEDVFIKDNEMVYLVTLPQLEFNGIQGRGDVNAEKTAQFISWVKDVTNKNSFSSTRVVGKFGLAYALARMTISGVGISGELSTAINPFDETFYQVIITAKKTPDWGSQPDSIKIIELGKTGGDKLSLKGWIDLPISDMVRAYNNGWRKNFEVLA